ncbi:MAG: FAD-dependent oxidoreductase [Betaproteobacteria bacterium]|nr:FAD-dependent oxidoreductase [Betaproteobacteria bacterium]
MTESDTRSDVVVIGGGIAGLVAANRAAQLGKSVILLEKGTDEKYPCNTRWTGGTFHIHFTDPLSNRDKLLSVIESATKGFAHKELAQALAEDSPRLIQWLWSEGIRTINLGGYHTCILAPPSRTGPGLEWEGRGGDVMLRTLEANLRKLGGRLVRGARARALDLSSPDGVVVDAECGGKTTYFRAGDVVIADGGFPADPELIRAHISPHPEKILRRNAGTATGDGFRMAMAVGAAVTGGLDCFYGHLLSRDAMRNNRLWPRPYLDALVTSGIVIDGEGRRFADEGNGGVYMANAVARLNDPLSATLVFDHATWTGPGAKSIIPANPHLPNGGGTIHKAQTIAELAGMIGVPAQTLQEVVDNYNRALDSGTLDRLSPPRRSDWQVTVFSNKALPIKVAPFYAVPVCTGITHIMGGIAIDANSAVLDKNNKPIPHLYAAGTATGGLEGGPAIGYLGGLTKSGVTGLRAAERIAQLSSPTGSQGA